MIIDDNYIINLVLDKNGKLNSKKYHNVLKSTNDDIIKYLANRFDDSYSKEETLYRICHNLIIKPKCKVCGKVINYINIRPFFKNYCCDECKHKYIYQQVVKGVYNKYEVNNVFETDWCINKIKNTNLNKYGVNSYLQTKECREITESKEIRKKSKKYI